jgi:hypothetical protein
LPGKWVNFGKKLIKTNRFIVQKVTLSLNARMALQRERQSVWNVVNVYDDLLVIIFFLKPIWIEIWVSTKPSSIKSYPSIEENKRDIILISATESYINTLKSLSMLNLLQQCTNPSSSLPISIQIPWYKPLAFSTYPYIPSSLKQALAKGLPRPSFRFRQPQIRITFIFINT